MVTGMSSRRCNLLVRSRRNRQSGQQLRHRRRAAVTIRVGQIITAVNICRGVQNRTAVRFCCGGGVWRCLATLRDEQGRRDGRRLAQRAGTLQRVAQTLRGSSRGRRGNRGASSSAIDAVRFQTASQSIMLFPWIFTRCFFMGGRGCPGGGGRGCPGGIQGALPSDQARRLAAITPPPGGQR